MKNGIDLTTKIAGVKIAPCIMNASGPSCTEWEELEAIALSNAGAVVLKSATLMPRDGNPEPRWAEFPGGSINSMGLPNKGYLAHAKQVRDLKRIFTKPVVASVAGFSANEYCRMAQAFAEAGADMLELNLSCPNVEGKPQTCYDFGLAEKILRAARGVVKCPMGVKLSPFFDPVHRERMAGILLRTGVDFVVLINSPGHGLVIDTERETALIRPNHGMGGIGGEVIKPIALGNIWGFYRVLGDRIPIIGVGGVTRGRDIFEHVLAGAAAVQVGTAYEVEGVGIFSRLEEELCGFLREKWLENLMEKRGKLKLP